MKAIKALLLIPLGLALGGCMSYGGGTAYNTYPTYGPGYTYSAPAYTYSAPAYTYSQPGYYGQPAIVAPSGSYYYGQPSSNVSRYDSDGDGVSNSMDRYPYDSRRW